MPKVYLTLKLLPVISKPWCRMTATHTGEVCRELDRKLLEKYQKLQKFWSAHIHSNLIVLFLGAIVFSRWTEQLRQLADSTAVCSHSATPYWYIHGQPGQQNWGSTGSFGDDTENKNSDAWIMFTYCYLYVLFPGKKKALEEHQDCLYIAWLLQKLFPQFFFHPLYFHVYTKFTVFDILLI